MAELSCPVCGITSGIMCVDAALVNNLVKDLYSAWTVKSIEVKLALRCPSGHVWYAFVPFRPGAETKECEVVQDYGQREAHQ